MKITKHKSSKPYKRKLLIGKDTWTWRVANQNVWIRSPDGKITIATDGFELNHTSSKWHFDTYDAWDWDRQSPHWHSVDIPMPPITPKLIKKCILESFLFADIKDND